MSTSKCHLFSLPPEILQHIYLYSLSPNFPHASPFLATVLSAPHIYRLTFLHAFWNSTSFQKCGVSGQLLLHWPPGLYLRRLLDPPSYPLSVSGPQEIDVRARMELQESVMRCRWCTFDNAKPWLEEISLAVIKDLVGRFNWPSLPDTQTHLEYFIADSAASRFVVPGFNGSELSFRSAGPFLSAFSTRYRSPHPRAHISIITLAPTTFLVLPPHFLTGNPEWTREKVDKLQLFGSYVNLHAVECRHEAFHEGMRNAIIQRHYDALLTLVWIGTRLAEAEFVVFSRWSAAESYRENPLKPLSELFRLVAKQGMRPFAATSDESSGYQVKTDDADISMRLFTLLLRAHAESMPQNDPDIEAWVNHLSTCQDSDGTIQALAQWVIDWRSSDWRSRDGKRKLDITRQPLFRAGLASRRAKDDMMGIRLEEILGGEPLGFEEQMMKSALEKRSKGG